MRFTLGKEKKLKSKKAITELFESGSSIRKGALRLKYAQKHTSDQHKCAFSVPKRFFKHAVDRNRVKRLLRESYRLQQHDLPVLENKHLNLMWIYQSHKLPDQDQIKKLMQSVIKQLNKSVAAHKTD